MNFVIEVAAILKHKSISRARTSFERHVGVPTIEQNVDVSTIAQNVDAPTIAQDVDRRQSHKMSMRRQLHVLTPAKVPFGTKKNLIRVTECCFTWKKCCFT
jgi:hypothetical protein